MVANFSTAIFTFNCFSSEKCKTKIVNMEINAVKIIVKTGKHQRRHHLYFNPRSIIMGIPVQGNASLFPEQQQLLE